ncbi:hypothetical protein BDF14DRAFT_1886019 [Spinellus fusiger]|nr:hypothetical protein BDF14DRAFT_1886019 [Spinellus fusiger]
MTLYCFIVRVRAVVVVVVVVVVLLLLLWAGGWSEKESRQQQLNLHDYRSLEWLLTHASAWQTPLVSFPLSVGWYSFVTGVVMAWMTLYLSNPITSADKEAYLSSEF